MSLKAFTERYTEILEKSEAEQLRCILINMAYSVTSECRKEFIDKLLLQAPVPRQKCESQDVILENIKLLLEEVRAQSEEEPDWDEFSDDDDTLAEFSRFLPEVYVVFDKIEACFDDGDYRLVRDACDVLFTIFDIQDDYGRGISIHDLDALAWDEIAAKYLRVVYCTEQNPKSRVEHILQAMLLLLDIDSSSNAPKLENLMNISVEALPDWSEFLQQWIRVTKSESGLYYDAWYREGVYLFQGIEGLKALAKVEGEQRPRVYVDWIKSLIESENYGASLETIQEALEQLPKNQPIRSVIGDFKYLCGNQLNDKKIQLDGQWVSFDAKPDLSKLISLYLMLDPSDRTEWMDRAAESIKTYEERMQAFSKRELSRIDSLESPSYPTFSLLMHAYLLSNNVEDAFILAQQGASLGWRSSNNPQPLFVVYCLIKATKQSLHLLPKALKKLIDQVLNNSKGTWMYDEAHSELFGKLELAYADLLMQPHAASADMYAWCLKIAEERISGIVSNQHRGAYDRAALLVAACTESLRLTSQEDSSLFYNRIKNQFPRHSAFQGELRQVCLDV